MSTACGEQWMSIAPELWLVGTALLVLLLERTGAGKDGESMGYFSILGMTGALACVVLDLGTAVRRPLGGLMIVDGFADFFTLCILAAAMLVTLMGAHAMQGAGEGGGKRCLFLLLSTLGMLLMVKGEDLVLIFLGLALSSITSTLLASPGAEADPGGQTARRHLRLSALAAGAFLLGVFLVFARTGTTSLEGIVAAVAGEGLVCDLLFQQGMVLILAGLGGHIALVPFHGWLLRLSGDASPALTAWLDVALKTAVLGVTGRVLEGALPALTLQWRPVLWVLAVATMGLGNLAALAHTDLRRILVGYGIAHTGFLLVGVVAGGALGWSAVLYFVPVYGLMSLGALAMVLWCSPQGCGRLELGELSGLGLRCPALGAALGIFMLSLAGIPPFSGFMGKFFIFSAAMDSGYLWLAVIGAAHCLCSAYCCLRVVAVMYLEEPKEGLLCPSEGPVLVVAVIAMAGTLLAGLWPGPLLAWALESARWLLG